MVISVSIAVTFRSVSEKCWNRYVECFVPMSFHQVQGLEEEDLPTDLPDAETPRLAA